MDPLSLHAAGVPGGQSFLSDQRGIGRRMLRELCADGDVSSPTSADIALDELVMIAQDRSAVKELYRTINGGLKVELVPGVYVTADMMSESAGSTEPSTRSEARECMLDEWMKAVASHVDGLNMLVKNLPTRSAQKESGRDKRKKR